MKITVYVVSTCIPERGAGPCLPSVFGAEAEAEAYAEEMLRVEWDNASLEDDQGAAIPFPGDWREANDIINAKYFDGSWGKWQLTSHEIEIAIPAPVIAKLEGIQRLAEDRGMASTNFQLNVIADEVRSLIEKVAA